MKSQADFNQKTFNNSPKPSPLAGVYYFCLLFLFISCSAFRLPLTTSTASLDDGSYNEMDKQDFADHLASLKGPFLQSSGIKTLRKKKAKLYLEKLSSDIIARNEIFFKRLKEIEVILLEMDAPLHFSLPKGHIFLSTGLISKYIKNESMLVSILSFELVRSENLLYPKRTIIPTGHIPLERMLTLFRLTLDEKMEIHKWAYHLTVRSGYDGEYYLSWLQIQNRNTADFLLQVGDVNLINREESLFKAFLINITKNEEVPGKSLSSRGFYSFLNSIRDQNS